MKLHCHRTNCSTGEKTFEWHRAKIKLSPSVGWCVELTPGITGYESFIIEDFMRKPPEAGWHACAGTPGSWDTLFVPQAELDRLIDVLELLPVYGLPKAT